MQQGQKPNRLQKEKSPYLKQHAYNPVDWYAWGEEAFEAARSRDVPILLSIGYATCHWCHVMERESFEDDALASYLNANFVAIKVDREERPDVDQIYMKALHGMGVPGGWPLNMFLTPDLKPFTGGTYFPPRPAYGRASFRQVLETVTKLWQNERHKIMESGQAVFEFLSQESPPGETLPGKEVFAQAEGYFKNSYDAELGGFRGNGPNKFPPSMTLLFLMRRFERTGDRTLLKIVEHTLEAMKRGGIYDQIGGGLSRYATDQEWLVPHFEKMLYDNALFMSALCEAYRLTENPRYKQWALDVFAYLERDMSDPEGAFYSAEDADSEGEEGRFYIWQEEEFAEVLATAAFTPEEISRVRDYFGVTPAGNFEGANVLTAGEHADEIVERAREVLLAHRSKRERPLRDDKILLSWNALAASALARMGRVFEDERLTERARRVLVFIEKSLKHPDGFYRRFHSGEARYAAGLQDYAMFGLACLDLYRADFDAHWLSAAAETANLIRRKFGQNDALYDTEEGLVDLIVRTRELYDGVEPSGNSGACLLFARLAGYGFGDLHAAAENAMTANSQELRERPAGSVMLLMALDLMLDPLPEFAAAGPDAIKELMQFHALPGEMAVGAAPGPASLLSGRESNETLFFVCRNQACELPVRTAPEARALLEKSLDLKRY